MKTVLISHLFICILFFPGMVKSQSVSISGYIKNSENENALENVSIFENITGIGTITDKNGFFKLFLNTGSIDISASIENFKTISKKIELSGDTIISVKLLPEFTNNGKQEEHSTIHADLVQKGKKPIQKRRLIVF